MVLYCGRECQVAHWKSTHKAECGKSKEDLMHEQHSKNSVPTNQVDLVNMMVKMALSKAPATPEAKLMQKIVAFYEQTPDLEAEFAAYMRQMKISDIPAKGLELLREVVVGNRSQFMKELVFYKQFSKDSSGMNTLLSDPDTFFKVINSCDEHKIDWFTNASMFDVYDRSTLAPYEFSIHHSFSNARARKERFETGRVHVAVGFVDLSLLLEMDLVRGDNPGPFHFVGYEASVFSVAKTMVIAEMLRRKDPEIIDAILQVWYSSCWSEDTLKIFRLAVSEAIEVCKDDKVIELLSHWSKVEPKSIDYARQQWLKKIDTSIFDPAVNALDKKARNRLCQYFLTGQLLPAAFASIAMFELPKKFGSSRSRDESCFHSLDITNFMNATKQNNGDFVAGAIGLMSYNITQLHEFVSGGEVAITIKPPTIVSIDSPQVMAEISAMSPYTISWNNCLDYMPTKEFHRLARACSAAEDTVHYGYSMNWPADVFGASCLTYPVGEVTQKLLDNARHSLSMLYALRGMKGLLKCPSIDNPINVMDHLCRIEAYKHWIKKFFQGVPNVAQTEPSFYSVFDRASTALFFTWSYDTSISFTGLQHF